MSGSGSAVRATLEALETRGWEEAEVFYKRSRSRQHLLDLERSMSSLRSEEGWAARAGDRRRSFFYAASGPPEPGTAWPEADGLGLRLPASLPIGHWKEPSDLDAALLGENEARALFEGLVRELASELPGARLVAGSLEDGSAESEIASSRGVRAAFRQRIAYLRLEARGPRGDSSAALELPAREARRFQPLALARRLADRLLIAERGEAPERDRGDMLLAPSVAAALLASLSGCWIGPEAADRAALLSDRGGKLGSPRLDLIDDGRLAGGLLEAPVDGEGLPTREVVLVEEGRFRQPLLAWAQLASTAPVAGRRASGCMRRASWRDLPRPGASHLYLRPDPSVPVSGLLAELRRGYYLVDPVGACRVDEASRRFRLPVCGFAIERGKPVGPVAGAVLTGTLGGLLHGILAVARDLSFTPMLGGMVGAPTLLARGLELRRGG